MKSNWLVVKRYPHLDLPAEDKKSILSLMKYVLCKDNIAKHSFLPLIRRNIVTYPFKKKDDGKRKRTKKIRPITYASHSDSAIFSYYGFLLSKEYEKYVEEYNLNDVACAYRSIKCKSRQGNKCNIDIAKEVFDFIKEKMEDKENVSVITFDIKGFYDNLDHQILKQAWMKVMNEDSLTDDEYNVFKNITKYSYVEEDKIFDLFKDKIICKTTTKSGDKKYVKCKVKKSKYLREKNAIAFCEKKDIKKIRDEKLICQRARKYTYGIPQGLTISPVLANIYMLEFDKEIAESINKIGGLYRRYSDDIIIVCPIDEGPEWKDKITNEIHKYKLEIEISKTNLYNFKKLADKVICAHEKLGKNKKLEYLGFSYDGNKVLLKDSGVGKYYYKMNLNLKRAKWMSCHVKNKYLGTIFENKLIKKFSYAGAVSHYIYTRNTSKKPDDPQFICFNHRKSYVNFLGYMLKASRIMNEKSIKHQLSRNMTILKTLLNKAKYDVHKVITSKTIK